MPNFHAKLRKFPQIAKFIFFPGGKVAKWRKGLGEGMVRILIENIAKRYFLSKFLLII